jgi:NADPH:quinone reductase-like Zn-dependent oxidoreductase
MRAVQITRVGPEVLDIVDVPEPTPGPGQQLYDVSTAGLNFADTHHSFVLKDTSAQPATSVGASSPGQGGMRPHY